MGKRLLILTVLGFGLFITPTSAENPAFCQYSFDPGRNITANVAIGEEKPKVPERVWVTAYSSTPEETDSDPFITASQTEVRDGVIAANFLPFGTKVMMPDLFGEKIFVVEDRMHRRKTNFVDIWMPSTEAAKEFGIVKTKIVIVELPA